MLHLHSMLCILHPRLSFLSVFEDRLLHCTYPGLKGEGKLQPFPTILSVTFVYWLMQLFAQSGLEVAAFATMEDLSNHMGLFLQVNFVHLQHC